MANKLFAGFCLNQMAKATGGSDTVDLLADNICICLWPTANRPSAANLDDASILTVAQLATAVGGGAIHDAANSFADITPKSISVRAFGLSAGTSVTITAPPVGAAMDFLLIRRDGVSPDTTDNVIGYNDAGVTPNGVDDIQIDLSSAVLRYGEASG